jgi:hypothetical protein
MLEDEVERTHQDGSKFARQMASLPFELRVDAYAHHVKVVNDTKVSSAKTEALEKMSRKRKGVRIASAGRRRVRAKDERKMVRAGNLVYVQVNSASAGNVYNGYRVKRGSTWKTLKNLVMMSR